MNEAFNSLLQDLNNDPRIPTIVLAIFLNEIMNDMSANFPLWIWLFLASGLVWSIVWKGLALWRAAKRDHRGWFIALLLLNTIGLLEIYYLYVVDRGAKSFQVKDDNKPV